MAHPTEYNYHECKFCESMVIDFGNRVDVRTGAELEDKAFFFEPTLADALAAKSLCPLAKSVVIDCEVSSSHITWDELWHRSSEIKFCARTSERFLDYIYYFDSKAYRQWKYSTTDPATNQLEPPPRLLPGTRDRDGLNERMFPAVVDLDMFILALEDDPAASVIATRPISSKPSSPETLQLIKEWVAECEASHKSCPKSRLPGHSNAEAQCSPSKLSNKRRHDGTQIPEKVGSDVTFTPKRLLKVVEDPPGQNLLVSLHPGSSCVQEQYVALSYCWGGDQLHKITSETLKVTEGQELPWETIPRSIQDALRVTVGLGFRWLWVDSLCILQDDKTEMAQQIALMPKIYSQACLTIVAAKAASVNDGFLQNIDPLEVMDTDLAVKLPFIASASAPAPSTKRTTTRGAVYAFRMGDGDQMFPDEPTDLRGWTFQERYLSTRLLEFRTHQVRLTCVDWQNTFSRVEDTESKGSKKSFQNGWINSSYEPDALLEGGGKKRRKNVLSSELVEEYCENFYDMVVFYTGRQLSDPRDRLLAISGIGQVFLRNSPQDEYLAGIWRTSLPFGLLWLTSFNVTSFRPSGENYQAPSWSWAACSGHVSFDEMRWAMSSGLKPSVSAIEPHIDPVEFSAPCGAVRPGSSIAGAGKLVEVLWYGVRDKWNSRVELYENRPGSSILTGSDDRWIDYADTWGDALESEHHEVQDLKDHKKGTAVKEGRPLLRVRLLEVAASQSGDESIGLILRPMDNPSSSEELSVTTSTVRQSANQGVPRYSRMGLFKIRRPDRGKYSKSKDWTKEQVEDARRKAKRFIATFRGEPFEIV